MSEEASLDEFAEETTIAEAETGSETSGDELQHPRFGSLPSGWDIREVVDVAEIVGGSTPSTSNDEYWDGGIPWATPTDITGLSGNEIGTTPDTLTKEGLGSASTHLLPPQSVLMTSRATIGECAVNTVEMATNQGFKSLVPRDDIETWYLYYRILGTAPFLESLGAGSTFDEVSKSVMESVEIPIAPLEEQRKIATVLYTIDQAIQKTEEIEAQIRRARSGIVQDVLTFGVSESEVSDTGTVLGRLPEHWEVATIDEIVADEDHAFTDGARYSLSSAEIHDEGDARAILLQEVGEGEFNDIEPKFATAEKYEEITHRAIYPGEVVVAKMAEPVARACIVPDTYGKYLLGCADVVRVLTNDEFDDRFLMYCMNSHKLWSQAVAHLRGTGRSRINLENISELNLPKPPLHEQVKIAEAIQQFDRRIENEQDYQNQLKRLKQGLMQDLLSGTVRTHEADIDIPEAVLAHG